MESVKPDLKYVALHHPDNYFYHLNEIDLERDPTGSMIGVHLTIRRERRFETSFSCPFHCTEMATIHPIETSDRTECRKLQSRDKVCICMIYGEALTEVLQASVGSTVNAKVIIIHLKAADTLASVGKPYWLAGEKFLIKRHVELNFKDVVSMLPRSRLESIIVQHYSSNPDFALAVNDELTAFLDAPSGAAPTESNGSPAVALTVSSGNPAAAPTVSSGNPATAPTVSSGNPAAAPTRGRRRAAPTESSSDPTEDLPQKKKHRKDSVCD